VASCRDDLMIVVEKRALEKQGKEIWVTRSPSLRMVSSGEKGNTSTISCTGKPVHDCSSTASVLVTST
jgi:hypothetical protein